MISSTAARLGSRKSSSHSKIAVTINTAHYSATLDQELKSFEGINTISAMKGSDDLMSDVQ